MTWKFARPDEEILRAVVDEIECRRDGVLPMDHDRVAGTYADEAALLAALQQHWRQRLAARLEHATPRRARERVSAVESAWGDVANEMPGVRLVLDRARERAHEEESVVVADTAAATREHVMLAVAAGLTDADDPSASRVGAEVERAARQRRQRALAALAVRAADDGATTALVAHGLRRGLLGRLRSLIPA